MDNIFGLSMNVILVVLASIMFLCILSVIAIAIFNPIVFKMALRNPPRRKTQSLLIVIGLMLATLIVSAALTTGDTLDYSIKKITYDSLGAVDETIAFVGNAGGEGTLSVTNEPIDASLADELTAEFEGSSDIKAFMPVLTVDVPAINDTARLSEPSVILTGLDWDQVGEFGGIISVDGGQIDLSQIGPGEAILSETLADNINAVVGDSILIYINNQPVPVTVAAIGQDSILTGLFFGQNGPEGHGLAMELEQVQTLTGLEGKARFIAVTNTGDPEAGVSHSDAAVEQLQNSTVLAQGQYGVNPVKADSVEGAELVGNAFMSIFLVLGLFSIFAGILLIILIFMMLAAERRSEMGMARAVGMRQSSLVQMFMAEGTVYDLGAALVGAALGVLIAFGMVNIMDRLIGDLFSLTPKFTFRSLAAAYALGVSVTFVTIIFASARAAKLNIVSAIRDLPEPPGRGDRRPRWIWWKKLPRFGGQIGSTPVHWISLLWVPLEIIPNLILYPFRLVIWLIRVLAYYTGWGPLLLPIGLLLMLFGWSRAGESFSLALYSSGLSITGIGLMLILSKFISPRLVYSVISFVLLLWWLTPDEGILADIFGVVTPNNLEGDFEMFFISGIMMVTFATLLVIWNAEVIIWIISSFGRLFARWLPAVKTAVAYPLASKTKTGLTLAMFGLIVFSLVTMSTLNANFVELFTTEDATAGWDVRVQTSPNNPIDDLETQLVEADVDTNQYTAFGRVLLVTFDNSQIITSANLAKDSANGDEANWKRIPLNGVDASFAENTIMPLKTRSAEFASDADVWAAIAAGQDVAVIDSFSAGGSDGFGNDPDAFNLNIDTSIEPMEPVAVTISDPGSGDTREVMVVGVIDDAVSTFFGLFMPAGIVTELYTAPDATLDYIQLADKSTAHAQQVSKDIESAFFENGVLATSTQEELEDQAALNQGFINLIQGFMGLGLLVGIAALGVISFRSVVERRQQIGMLRAIGYQRSMIAASFLMEAMVVAVLGILSGMILGLILARNLINSPDFAEGANFDQFIVPWLQIGVMLGIALVAAAIMTIIPARGAASVPVADALRYE